MKKYLSFFLAFSIIFSFGVTSVSASEVKSEITVSLDTIEGLMLKNSTSLHKIYADLEKASSDYNNYKNRLDDLREESNENPNLTLTAQIISLQPYCDAAKITYLTLKTLYDKSVMLQVLKTKQLYLTYLLDIDQAKIKETQLKNKEQDLAVYKKYLEAGYISKNAYEQATLELKPLQDGLNTQVQKTNSDLISLKTALGIDVSAEINVLPASYDESVFDTIPSIVFDDDDALMLKNNVDIQAKQAVLDIKQHALIKSQNDINATRIDIQQSKETAELNFRQQFDSLQDAYRNFITARSIFENKKLSAENGKIKFQNGLCSKSQLQDLELAASTAELNQNALKNTLFLTYTRYMQMKNGD